MNLRRFWSFGLAAGLLTLGAVASSESLAFALADAQPELAITLNSEQSDALSNLASQSLREGSTESPDNGRLPAQRAIAIDPFDAQAAAHLGLLLQLDGKQASAASAMEYAQRISRRDASTQFWWIEYWAQRGELDNVLHHYDAALRSSEQAPSTLFPILISAVENPLVSRKLAERLDNTALWTDQFVQQFAQSSQNTAAIGRFFLNLADADFITSELAISTAISRLAESGNVAQGFALFAAFYPEAGTPFVQDPMFAGTGHIPTPFDWILAEADFYLGLGADGLEIDAPASASGPIVSQVTRLPAGDWQVRLSHDGGLTGSERLNLDLICLDIPINLQPILMRKAAALEAEIQIPPSCDYQKLTVSFRSSDRATALSLKRIELERS